MGLEKPHLKVKLVIPVLYSDRNKFLEILQLLEDHLGPADYDSGSFPFEFTGYYDDEMDTPIFRQFISYEKLIEPEELVPVKLMTNRLELQFAVSGKRKINLDPGYLELGKFVLATTKDQQHRLYIRDSIFEEITLFYRNKLWQHWEWTYPDYRSEKYKSILTEIRNIYKNQLKKSP